MNATRSRGVIRAAKHRVVFIDNGFLDRNGDETHTSLEAGKVSRKGWNTADEYRNVDIGLELRLFGKTQIGICRRSSERRRPALCEFGPVI